MPLDPLETRNIQMMNQLIQTIRNDITGNAKRAKTIKDFLARCGIYIEINPFFATTYEPTTMAIIESIQSAMSQAMTGLPLGGNRVLFQEVARNYTMEKVTNLGNDMKTQLKEITSQGLKEGKAPMQIAKDMSQKVASLGRTRAETIAQTETHRAKNLGNWFKYKEAGYNYFMVSYAGNACPYCKRAYENRVFHIDELKYLPPFHTRCRCGAKFYRNLSDLPSGAVIHKPGTEVPKPDKAQLKDYRKQFKKPSKRTTTTKSKTTTTKQAEQLKPNKRQTETLYNYNITDKPDVNYWLRHNKLQEHPLGSPTKAEMKLQVKDMDTMLNKSITSKDKIVYRGVPEKVYGDVKVGSRISDKGYMSTSVDLGKASEFGNTVLEIKLPAGSKAIEIDKVLSNELVSGRFKPYTTPHLTEQEFVLPRNREFKVTGFSQKEDDWGTLIKVVKVEPT